MGLFQIYRSLGIDGSLIGFTDSEIAVPHFCYPVNATAIGFECSATRFLRNRDKKNEKNGGKYLK